MQHYVNQIFFWWWCDCALRFWWIIIVTNVSTLSLLAAITPQECSISLSRYSGRKSRNDTLIWSLKYSTNAATYNPQSLQKCRISIINLNNTCLKTKKSEYLQTITLLLCNILCKFNHERNLRLQKWVSNVVLVHMTITKVCSLNFFKEFIVQ